MEWYTHPLSPFDLGSPPDMKSEVEDGDDEEDGLIDRSSHSSSRPVVMDLFHKEDDTHSSTQEHSLEDETDKTIRCKVKDTSNDLKEDIVRVQPIHFPPEEEEEGVEEEGNQDTLKVSRITQTIRRRWTSSVNHSKA